MGWFSDKFIKLFGCASNQSKNIPIEDDAPYSKASAPEKSTLGNNDIQSENTEIGGENKQLEVSHSIQPVRQFPQMEVIKGSHQNGDNVKADQNDKNETNSEMVSKTGEKTNGIDSNDDNIKDEELSPNTITYSELTNSENKVIKECVEAVNNINNEIEKCNFIHKTTDYKRIDRELFKLMVKLDDIEVEDNSKVKEERRTALTEIHELIKKLDEKIQCKVEGCIICKTGIELKK